MTAEITNGEATAIAALYGSPRDRVLGYVYQWETGQISLMILLPDVTPSAVIPAISKEALDRAKHETPVAVLKLLEGLRTN